MISNAERAGRAGPTQMLDRKDAPSDGIRREAEPRVDIAAPLPAAAAAARADWAAQARTSLGEAEHALSQAERPVADRRISALAGLFAAGLVTIAGVEASSFLEPEMQMVSVGGSLGGAVAAGVLTVVEVHTRAIRNHRALHLRLASEALDRADRAVQGQPAGRDLAARVAQLRQRLGRLTGAAAARGPVEV